MRNSKLTAFQKLRIVHIANETGNIRRTARKFKGQSKRIKEGQKMMLNIRGRRKISTETVSYQRKEIATSRNGK